MARELLTTAGFTFSGDGREHQQVIDLMKRSSLPDVKAAAQQLQQLRTTRQSADYDVGSRPLRGKPFDDTRATHALLLGHSIVTTLQRIAKQDRRLGLV